MEKPKRHLSVGTPEEVERGRFPRSHRPPKPVQALRSSKEWLVDPRLRDVVSQLDRQILIWWVKRERKHGRP